MHIIQEEIGLPAFSVSLVNDGDESHAIFTIEPLPPGYGMTLGNGLRRVLLSSLPGAAVTSLRCKGISHEYSTIKGVHENVLDIALNAKQLKLRNHSKDAQTVSLSVKGPKDVTAKDLSAPSDVEVLDSKTPLFTIEKGASVDMEFSVEKGVGYVPASEFNKKKNEPGLIFIDAVFSPVLKVRYDVESARVGQRTDLEKLLIEVQTNGSLPAEEAIRFAAQLLKQYFDYFCDVDTTVESEFMADFSRRGDSKPAGDDSMPVKESYTPIEILNFSPRTLNALINAGIGSIEQLTKCTEATLSNVRGFGTKALDEVRDTLAERNLALSQDSSAE